MMWETYSSHLELSTDTAIGEATEAVERFKGKWTQLIDENPELQDFYLKEWQQSSDYLTALQMQHEEAERAKPAASIVSRQVKQAMKKSVHQEEEQEEEGEEEAEEEEEEEIGDEEAEPKDDQDFVIQDLPRTTKGKPTLSKVAQQFINDQVDEFNNQEEEEEAPKKPARKRAAATKPKAAKSTKHKKAQAEDLDQEEIAPPKKKKGKK